MSEETEVFDYYEEKTAEVFICKLCGIEKHEPLKDKQYCDTCSDNLHQAYQWMQSPMLSSAESKKLSDKILELTDVDKLIFE